MLNRAESRPGTTPRPCQSPGARSESAWDSGLKPPRRPQPLLPRTRTYTKTPAGISRAKGTENKVVPVGETGFDHSGWALPTSPAPARCYCSGDLLPDFLSRKNHYQPGEEEVMRTDKEAVGLTMIFPLDCCAFGNNSSQVQGTWKAEFMPRCMVSIQECSAIEAAAKRSLLRALCGILR